MSDFHIIIPARLASSRLPNKPLAEIAGSSRTLTLRDSAMRVVMAQLNTARERSVSERRQMKVEFVGTSSIRITREEVPTGETFLTTVPLEGGVAYTLMSGIGDTPDGFGHATAVDFGTATTFDVVTNDGAYFGGVIAPGPNLSLEALYMAAAKLPGIQVTGVDVHIGSQYHQENYIFN